MNNPKTIKFTSSFPNFGSKNIKLYYLLAIFLSGMFILPNWVFYFGRFIAIPAIALIDGLSKLVAVFLEIPSGAVSDSFGKKRTLIAGNACLALCCLILINASTFATLLIGNIVMFVGFALLSGAKEAILYDSLIDIKKEDEYDNVLGRVNTLTIATTITSIFIGGFLYSIRPELTFWAWFVFNIAAIVTLLGMKEPRAAAAEIEEVTTIKEYSLRLREGAKSIFSHSVIKFILPVLFFSMLIKAYEGVIRQNTGAYFGFTGETFGYLMALISIPALFVSYNYGRISKRFADRTQNVFIFLYAIGFMIVFLTNNLLFGVLSFVCIYAAQEIAKPYITSLINKNTDSRHRATALSTVSLFSEMPYMFITIFLGFAIEVEYIRYLYLTFTLSLFAYAMVRSSKGLVQR